MKQKIIFSSEARGKIREGINLAADVVCATFGPSGLNVVSNKIHGGIRSTKDGVSALNEIAPDDPMVAAGVKLARQAAQKTADEAGDSTTTTTMLAREIINNIEKELQLGRSPIDIRDELSKDCKEAVKIISDMSLNVGEDIDVINNIACTSANNIKLIGDLIGTAYKKIGTTGVISLEGAVGESSSVEVIGGYFLNKGMISPVFITDEKKRECILVNPLILIYDKRISKLSDLLPVLKRTLSFPMEGGGTTRRSLLIIANSVESEALGTLVANKVKGLIDVCVVFSPYDGIRRREILEDIAVFTGGKVVSEDYGMAIDESNFDPDVLGESQRVIVTKDRCVVVNGQGEPGRIISRRDMIKGLTSDAESESEKEYLRTRIGNIGKGVAILKIGGNTDIEQSHLRDLAEDAILAVRASIEKGYLPGGGSAMFLCSKKLDGILAKSLRKPMEVLTGIMHKEMNEEIKFGYGFDAIYGEYRNLLHAGVLDATKVVVSAIENAVSVSIMYLTTEVLISEIQDND